MKLPSLTTKVLEWSRLGKRQFQSEILVRGRRRYNLLIQQRHPDRHQNLVVPGRPKVNLKTYENHLDQSTAIDQ